MKKVTVTADKDSGLAVVPGPNNPLYGYVRVEQLRTEIDIKGWVKNRKATALILGSVAELQDAGFQAGQELEGKIIFKEQLTPFNKKDPKKDLKEAGKTKVVCMVEDKPIYRKAFYSQDAEAQDDLLPAKYPTSTGGKVSHTNSEAIKAAHAKVSKREQAANLDLE